MQGQMAAMDSFHPKKDVGKCGGGGGGHGKRGLFLFGGPEICRKWWKEAVRLPRENPS